MKPKPYLLGSIWALALALVTFALEMPPADCQTSNPASGLAAPGTESSSSPNLKYADILPARFGMKGQIRDSYPCGEYHPLDLKYATPLTRPGEKNCVSIAFNGPNGVYLNPVDEFDYGEIPALERLTRAQAFQLWGLPKQKSRFNLCMFALKAQSGADVFIDADFNEQKLVQYRLRSSLFKRGDWVSLRPPTLPPGSPKPDND